MIEAIYLLILLTLTYLLGIKLLRFMKINVSSAERILFSFGIGFVSLAVFVYILGLAGAIYIGPFLILGILIIIFSLDEINHIYLSVIHRLKKLSLSSIRLSFNFNSVCLIFLVFLIVGNFIIAMAPLSEWDSLAYHMALPKIYIQHHKIVDAPSIFYSQFPQGIELLYLIGDLFYPGGTFAALISFTLGVLATLTVMLLTSQFFSNSAAILAGLLFYGIPAIIERASQTMIDIPLTFFVLLCFYLLLKIYFLKDTPHKQNALRYVILFSIFLAYLITTKTNMAVLVFAFIFVILYVFLYINKFAIKQTAKYLLITFSIVLLFSLMWFGRSLIYRHDPFYPFLTGILSPHSLERGYLEESKQQIVEFTQKQHRGIIDLILSPFTMTFHPERFDSFMGLTPIFLIFLPLLYFLWQHKNVKDIALLALVIILPNYIMWYFSNPTLRYIFPYLALITPLCAYSTYITITNSRFKSYIKIALILVFLYSALLWAGMSIHKITAAIGAVSKETYLSDLKDNNPHAAMEWANKNLPVTSTIFLFNDVRGYYLDIAYVHGVPYTQALIDYTKEKDYRSLANRLRELEITHILIAKNSPYKYPASVISSMQTLLANNATELYQDKNFIIYVFR